MTPAGAGGVRRPGPDGPGARSRPPGGWPAGVRSAVAVALEVLGPLGRPDEPLGARTTYRVGGPAAVGVTARTTADLALVGEAARASGLEVLVVGNGSNLLVADGGFAGIAVWLAGVFEELDITPGDGWAEVRAGGAVRLPVLARRTATAGWGGLEWAVGVPGTVGGAVRMNAGGHGSDTAATLVGIHRFDLLTGDHGWVPAGELALGYRTSNLTDTDVVVDAVHRLRRTDPRAAERMIAGIVRWRRENQPGGQNAGSVFTNPPGDAAGRLIEAAGCKGLRWGTARVSPKHANFIIADDGGAADDVAELIGEVRRRVAEATGVVLATELRMVGFPGTPGGPPGPRGWEL